MGQPVLEIKDVRHRFGDIQAVDGANLSLEPGELICLVGPSGCGKSTLLRLVAGLESLQEGEILIGGQRMASSGGEDVPPEARGVGLLFQDYALFPHLTVAENVTFGLRGFSGEAKRQRAADVLGEVDMTKYANAYPHTLSGGQQQRVALARALAPAPKVMLLDEPFSGLDQRLREQVRDQAFHVLKESGAATLMVTHDPEEAMFMADRIAVMNAGKLLQVGTPDEIYFHPKNAFVAGFFSEMNEFLSAVHDKAAPTPFGPVPTNGFAEGAAVEVLMRPEALKVQRLHDDDPEPKYAAKVLASRILGRSSLIHLCVGDHSGQHLHLHSRMPGRLLPEEDEIVGIELDLDQAFVFPQKG